MPLTGWSYMHPRLHEDLKPAYAASAPETISISWVVIIACRCLLNLRESCFFSSLALSLALFMAFMRAASSDASASCSTLAHYYFECMWH